MVEVNARDRPGLLARLAHVIHAAGHQLHSAHIATYGERAVDVFYLTRSDGKKLSDSEGEALRIALAGGGGCQATIRKGPAERRALPLIG